MNHTITMADTASGRTLWSLAQRWAHERGSETFIRHHGHGGDPISVSWTQFTEEVDALRRRLASIGVGGQRAVVLALPNASRTVEMWLAIMANNAIVQAIDVESGSLAFEHSLRATDPVAVVVSPDNAAAAQKAIAQTASTARLLVVTGTGSGGAVEGLGAGGSLPDEASDAAIAGLLPTSGTSGAPKLVELTARNYVMGGERLARNSGFLTSDRHYLCSPFFHTNGQLYLCAPPFITGGSLAIVPKFSAGGYFTAARELGATVSSMVAPPMRMALRRAVDAGARVDAGMLRLIQYGMTMSAADWADWDRYVPQIVMRQIYGQTESVSGVLGGGPWENDDRLTIGRPFVGIPGVRLVDESGEEALDGQPGELWVEGQPGSSLMAGYHDAPEATERTLVDGRWLRTGDVMTRHPDGRFEFRGRQLHIIRRGGENLSTYALEVDLLSCPLVRDVAVTAVKDDVLDARVVAHVIPGMGYSEEAFVGWCRENLGRRGVPDQIREHVDFPRTASGRVIAREL